MARILAVDDEQLVLGVLKAVLSKTHEVATAQDGNTALSLIASSPPDLVISDIRMDPMNGIELLRRIRRDHPNLPVVMLTAYASAETVNETRQLGAFDYMTKPFTAQEVTAMVERVLAAKVTEKRQPTLDEVVKDYMTRSKLQNLCEAKIELADEMYWLGQENSKESLLAAINDALGRKDIQMDVIDAILGFRETTVRVKQVIADHARNSKSDAAKVMEEISRKVADAFVRNKQDAVKTAEYACELLHVEKGVILAADIQFFREYFECSIHHQAIQTAASNPAAQASESTPKPSSDILNLAAASGNAATVDVNNMIGELRQKPVLGAEELKGMDVEVLRKLGGAASETYKKIKRVIDAHISLADVNAFYSPAERRALLLQGISMPAIQELLKIMNAIADRTQIEAHMQKSIEASQQKETMTSFASRYFKKRFGSKWN